MHDDDDETCALCLVGSAAGPLAGDEYSLHLDVSDGGRSTLRATGASIAQGSGARPASVRMSASVGADASLIADPGALIACEGSRVEVSVELDLAETAYVEWHETVVLGRTGDSCPGSVTLRWDVRRAGRPLLRQRVDLSDPVSRPWLTSGNRVLASVLIAGPDVKARTSVRSRTAVAQRIDDHALLITVLAMDGADARAQVEQLLAVA